MRRHPIAAALNTRPKYVASTTLVDPQWADTTVLSGDVAAAVGELKAEPGGELQVHGSGNLIRSMFDDQLVDEIILLTYPVSSARARGSSPTRSAPDTKLELGSESRTTNHALAHHPGLPTQRAAAVRPSDIDRITERDGDASWFEVATFLSVDRRDIRRSCKQANERIHDHARTDPLRESQTRKTPRRWLSQPGLTVFEDHGGAVSRRRPRCRRGTPDQRRLAINHVRSRSA
jgi:hypothetical protein